MTLSLAILLALATALMLAGSAGATKATLATFGTTSGPLGGQLNGATGVAVNRNGAGGGAAGEVYVANRFNQRIEVFSASGEFVRAFGFDVVASGQNDAGAAFEVCRAASSPQDVCQTGTPSGAAGGLNQPASVTIDQATGNVFVADTDNYRVSVFSPNGTFQAAFGWNVNAASPAAQLQTCTASCQAGTPTPLGGGFGSGAGRVSAIAVDPGDSGHVYATDTSNLRVNEFTLALDGSDRVTGATFVRAFGWDVVGSGEHNSAANEVQTLTPTGGSGTFTVRFSNTVNSAPIPYNATPAQVQTALENMATIGAGNVSVTSPNPGGGVGAGGPYTVTFQGVFAGNDVPQMTRALSSAVAIAPVANGGGYEVCAVASGPADVCKAGTVGANNGQFATTNPNSVAVDGDGKVYLSTDTRIQVFNANGTFSGVFGPGSGSCPINGNPLSSVAIEPTNQHVFVTQKPAPGTFQLCEFEPDGDLVETSPASPLEAPGFTTDLRIGLGTADRAYVNLPAGAGNAGIYLLGPVPPPTAVIAPVTDVGQTTATFNGTVTVPAPGFATTYRFEYSSDGVNWNSAPVPDASAGSTPGDVVVSVPVSGLDPSTTYTARLVAETGPSSTSAPVTFTTAGAAPAITNVVADAQETSASLSGLVLPQNQATKYRFEWGTTAAYGNRVPASDRNVGSGTSYVAAFEDINGLQPNTTYHYRLVAINATGTTASDDQTFQTTPTGAPYGRRVPEMVSPLDKGVQGWVGGYLNFIGSQPSYDGDSFIFSVANGLPTTESNAESSHIAHRGPNGWVTSALALPQHEVTHPGTTTTPSSNVMFTPEGLGCMVTESQQSPTDDPIVDDMRRYSAGNLFRQAADGGSVELLTTVAPTNYTDFRVSYEVNDYYVVGASQDCRRVVFTTKLTYPGVASSGLYEIDNGELRNVGVLPNGAVASGIEVGVSGEGNITQRRVGQDGSSVIFSATSNDGNDAGSRALYLRDDGETVKVSASKTAVAAQGVTYQTATPTASKVLFLANYGLADNDSRTSPVATSCNQESPQACALYLYEPGSDRLRSISATNDASSTDGEMVAGVVDASDDLSRVYFVTRGRLADEGQSFGTNNADDEYNLYRWSDDGADGDVAYVASVAAEDFLGPRRAKVGLLMRNRQLWRSQATPDGERLLFSSRNDVTGYPAGQAAQAYLYDDSEGATVCLSCPRDGGSSAGDQNVSVLRDIVDFLGGGGHIGAKTSRPRSISTDGSTVVFSSADELAPGGVAGATNIYEWQEGSLRLLVTGPRTLGKSVTPDPIFDGMSASGRDVFIRTVDALDPRDTDEVMDAYDFRIDGRPAPALPVETPCDPLAGGCHSGGSSVFDPAPTTLGPAAPDTSDSQPRGKLSVRQLSRAQRGALVAGRTVRLTMSVNQAGRVTVKGFTSIRGLRATVLSAGRSVSKAGKVALSVRLSAAARRELVRRGRLRLRIDTRFSQGRGVKSMVTTLRAPRQTTTRGGK